MAENPKVSTRLRPIIHYYLDELVKTGAYGKGKAGVMRSFIEAGVRQAIESGVIDKKDVRDFGETLDDNDDPD
jgi:hypothetical protein